IGIRLSLTGVDTQDAIWEFQRVCHQVPTGAPSLSGHTLDAELDCLVRLQDRRAGMAVSKKSSRGSDDDRVQQFSTRMSNVVTGGSTRCTTPGSRGGSPSSAK